MAWVDVHGLKMRLPGLPLILCGPVVGRAEADTVTVWVALKSARTVTLRVYTRFEPDAPTRLTEKAIGTRSTIQLGEFLHVVAVTAKAPAGAPLVAGQLYFYDLFFSASAVRPVPEGADALQTDGIGVPASGATLEDLSPTILSYSQETRLPSFSLPPNELNKLRIANLSCRKPDGDNGLDAMPILDDLLAVDWPVADDRLHQMLLTGDQVYADGSSDVFLFLVMDAAEALLGWEEELPGVPDPKKDLLPDKREHVVKEVARLTTEDPENHMLRLGEFLALHLLAWSKVLWPQEFPTLDEVLPGRRKNTDPTWELVDQAGYRKRVAALSAFRDTLPAVRRTLANVPTYMIFDDHDVTDDWNMYRDWAERVYLQPLGRRLIMNAMAAYAVCQAWGSIPDRFEAPQPGDALLTALTAWHAAKGKSPALEAQITALLGMPDRDQTTSGVAFVRFETSPDQDARQPLARPAGALHWHYTIRGPRHEVLVLDSRTRRAFPIEPLVVPDQIAAADMVAQVPQIAQGAVAPDVTLAVATANLVTVPFFEGRAFYGQKKTSEQLRYWYLWLLRDFAFATIQRLFWGPYNPDLSDSWLTHSPPFETLISLLARRAVSTDRGRSSRVVVLSGDVHFSWAGRMRYWGERPFKEADGVQPAPKPVDTVFAFLTSSGAKSDGNLVSKLVHSSGYVPAADKLPEAAQWLGWGDLVALELTDAVLADAAAWEEYVPWMARQTPPMLALKDVPERDFAPKRPPDWRYRIDFLLGERPADERGPGDLLDLGSGLPSQADALANLAQAHHRHRSYAQDWGDGQEMIGKNNVAVLHFHWDGRTTLAAAATASATSLQLADSGGFPDPPFRVIIGAETLEVGDLHRGTHRCSQLVRGVFDTHAAAHDAGAEVAVAKAVVQRHWWRPDAKAPLKPLTTYVVSLELDDVRYPRPRLAGESA
ncbi:MAG TPA: hypothetical protein VGO80_01755 [Solirubrobacteraceae bacterium]|nr:hypothetical protein [Solirubrobacteraceae bacterium]